MRGHRRFHLRPHAPHAPHHTADTHVRPRALVCACGRPFRENAEDVMRMLNGAWRVSRLARASQRDHLRVSQRRPRPIRASLLSHSLSLSLCLSLCPLPSQSSALPLALSTSLTLRLGPSNHRAAHQYTRLRCHRRRLSPHRPSAPRHRGGVATTHHNKYKYTARPGR